MIAVEKWDGTGRTVVRGERFSGPWRSMRAMPPLLAPLNFDVDPGRAHVGVSIAPSSGPRSRRSGPIGSSPPPLPYAARDYLKELLAVCALDDVHVCRIKMAPAVKTSSAAAASEQPRLTRMFSLNLGNETVRSPTSAYNISATQHYFL